MMLSQGGNDNASPAVVAMIDGSWVMMPFGEAMAMTNFQVALVMDTLLGQAGSDRLTGSFGNDQMVVVSVMTPQRLRHG